MSACCPASLPRSALSAPAGPAAAADSKNESIKAGRTISMRTIDPKIDPGLEHIQRHRPAIENLGVVGPHVEAAAQALSGAGTQSLKGPCTERAGECFT